LGEEEEDGEERGVPEEWHLAAALAGCAGVKEMLNELDVRIASLEEVRILETAGDEMRGASRMSESEGWRSTLRTWKGT